MDIAFFDVIMARFPVALTAFAGAVILHVGLLVTSLTLKKTVSPLPLMELILRRFVAGLCDRLNRVERSGFALIIRGVIVFLIVVFCVGVMVYGVRIIDPVLPLIVFLAPLMILKVVLAASKDQPDEGAYRHLSRALNQNLVTSDKHGIRRAGVKALSITLVEWVIAPLITFIIAGYAGLAFYGALSLFVRVSGRVDSPFVSVFGLFYRVFRALLSFVGAMIVIVASLFSAGGKPFQGLGGVSKGGYATEAAFAYTQEVSVGGAIQNRIGEKISLPWLGRDGTTAKLSHQDILRIAIHYGVSVFIVFAVTLFLVYV